MPWMLKRLRVRFRLSLVLGLGLSPFGITGVWHVWHSGVQHPGPYPKLTHWPHRFIILHGTPEGRGVAALHHQYPAPIIAQNYEGQATDPNSLEHGIKPLRVTLDEASTHNSAKTHANTVFVTRDLDVWHFDPKINGFQNSSWNICESSLMILAASVYEISWGKTDRQTAGKTLARNCRWRG